MSEINTEAFEGFCEELRYKGVPVDNFVEEAKIQWYRTYLDNLEKDSIVQDYQNNSGQQFDSTFIGDTDKVLVDQLKDDFEQLIQQLQLLTQRMERVEHTVDMCMTALREEEE